MKWRKSMNKSEKIHILAKILPYSFSLSTERITMSGLVHFSTSNSGRKERSSANRQRIKLIVEQFNILPALEYLQQIAHELQNMDN